MAQIGYGYGSEFQLLRFMGHHRHLLEREISKVIGPGDFNWLDFGFSDPLSSISGDEELMGLSFLHNYFKDEVSYQKMMTEYSSYRINKLESWQNWDAVFFLNGVLYFVEAKAYVSELQDKKDHGGVSKSEILRFMQDQLPSCNVSEKWLQQYYQFANRLATTALVGKYLPAKFLYIFFENGYRKRKTEDSVKNGNKNASKEDFLRALEKEMLELGISEESIKGYMAPAVFINAEPNPTKGYYE